MLLDLVAHLDGQHEDLDGPDDELAEAGFVPGEGVQGPNQLVRVGIRVAAEEQGFESGNSSDTPIGFDDGLEEFEFAGSLGVVTSALVGGEGFIARFFAREIRFQAG